jgi:hypothetical protein
MMHQESSFDPDAGRYEPFTDMYAIQKKQHPMFIGSPYWIYNGPTIYEVMSANIEQYPCRLWYTSPCKKYTKILNADGKDAAEKFLKNYLDYGRLDGSDPPVGTNPYVAQYTGPHG